MNSYNRQRIGYVGHNMCARLLFITHTFLYSFRRLRFTINTVDVCVFMVVDFLVLLIVCVYLKEIRLNQKQIYN